MSQVPQVLFQKEGVTGFRFCRKLSLRLKTSIKWAFMCIKRVIETIFGTLPLNSRYVECYSNASVGGEQALRWLNEKLKWATYPIKVAI